MEKNFWEYARELNINSLPALEDLLNDKLSPQKKQKLMKTVKEFYGDNWFTRKDFISLIKKNPQYLNKVLLVWSVPEIEIWPDDNRILKEVKDEFVYINSLNIYTWPEAMAYAIWTVIKKHMKYDFMTEILDSEILFWEKWKNNILSLKRSLKQSRITNESYENLIKFVDRIIKTTNDASQKMLFLWGKNKFIDWKTKEKFKYSLIESLEDPITIVFLQNILIEGRVEVAYGQYSNKKTIDDYFNLGVWDCKHFAAIMYILYKELWIKYFPDSEMFQVIIPRHTYNLLTYRLNDKYIKNQYLDITDFIAWGALFVKQERIKQLLLSEDQKKKKGLS